MASVPLCLHFFHSCVRRLASFLFTDPATPESYTLSLHDALPILLAELMPDEPEVIGLLALLLLTESRRGARTAPDGALVLLDRKSTRLNSSHRCISYAVFCLKKKKQTKQRNQINATDMSSCTT